MGMTQEALPRRAAVCPGQSPPPDGRCSLPVRVRLNRGNTGGWAFSTCKGSW